MSDDRNDFSTFEIRDAFGMSHEKLRQWMRAGFIQPLKPAEGQGTKAEFSRSDVYKIILFDSLLKIGFNREKAADYLKKYTGLSKFKQVNYIGVIFFGGKGIAEFWTSNYDKLDDIFREMKMENWDQVHIIDFKNLKKKADDALANLPSK